MQFWRYDPLTPADQAWFEEKYPGYNDYCGGFWDHYRRACDPAERDVPMTHLEMLPPICRVCQMPCIFPRLDANDTRYQTYEGKLHAFCSEPCQFIFNEDPNRYLGYKNFWEMYDGWSLDEFVRKNDLLRADGKTLLAQPTLSTDRMWTIEDIEAIGYEFKDPLRVMMEQGHV